MRFILLVALVIYGVQDNVFGGWTIVDQQDGYHTTMDHQIVHGGTASGHVAANGTSLGVSLIISQALRADDYRGKRVRFSAFMRAKDVIKASGLGAVLFMRAEGGGNTLASYSTGNRPVGGTTDWVRQQIVLDIPPATVGLTFGFGMKGPGDVWIDDAALEVVGPEIPVSRGNVKPPPVEPKKVRIQQATYAKASTHPSNMDFEKAK